MRSSRRAALVLPFLLLVALGCPPGGGPGEEPPSGDGPPPENPATGEPRIAEDQPIEEPEDLSPPYVPPPLHPCQDRVDVAGFVPHARVRIYVDGTAVVTRRFHFGYAEVGLPRGLRVGETVTATQIVDGVESEHSWPVDVEAFDPADLTTPRVDEPLYECGSVAKVSRLVPGARVELFEDGRPVADESTGDEAEVMWAGRRQFQSGNPVTAQQEVCTSDPSNIVISPMSPSTPVDPAPRPPSAPSMDEPIVGNDAVILRDLFEGARVEVRDQSTVRGSGYAFESAHRVPISDPVERPDRFTARQELCQSSPASRPIPPTYELPAPRILPPVCAGAPYVRVAGTRVNANVLLFRNGRLAGYGGARPGVAHIGVGGAPLRAGQDLTVRQDMGSNHSPVSSPSVPVVDRVPRPRVDVSGGREVTAQITGETFRAFVREEDRGPVIRAWECCAGDEQGSATARILGPDGGQVAEIELSPEYPGAYRGRWAWTTRGAEVEADRLPPGTYRVVVESPCSEETAEAELEVVIGEPDRSDATPPDVSLDVEVPDSGERATVRAGGSGMVIQASFGETVDVTARGTDREGLRRVAATVSGASPPSIEQTAAARPPIPVSFSARGSFSLPNQTTTVRISAEAENFNGSATPARTPTVRIDVQQPKPVIDRIDPDRAFSDETLDIEGEHLSISGLTTFVRFTLGGDVDSVQVSGASEDRITGVSIPSRFEGQNGSLRVEVLVTSSAGPTSPNQTSNAETVELIDREAGGFSKVNESDVDGTQKSCTGGPGQAFNQVRIGDGSSWAADALAIFESSGTVRHRYPFNVYEAQARELGGVAISDGCLNGIVLSQNTQFSGNFPRFNVRVVHAESGGGTKVHDRTGISLHAGSQGFVTDRFAVLSSPDETLVVIARPNNPSTSGQVGDLILSVHDFVTGDTSGNQSFGCSAGCDVQASTDGRSVMIRIDGQLEWTYPIQKN